MSFFDDVIEPSLYSNRHLERGVEIHKEIDLRNNMTIDNFMWRTKDSHRFVKPSDMETRHLFFTIRMIWNNTMPEKYRQPPIRLYSFGPFYSSEYFALAVRACLLELGKRNDLTEYFKRSLKYFRSCIEEVQGKKLEDLC